MLSGKPLLFRFLVVGLGNTALGLSVIFVASRFVGSYAANLIGYLIVVPVSFITHRDFSFRDTGRRASAFARFVPSIGAGYIANLVTLRLCLPLLPGIVAQASAIAVHVAVTFVCSRYFVFLRSRDNHAL